MATTNTPRGPLSYADLCALPDDGRRFELLGGEPVEMNAPRMIHQRAVVRLVVLLEAHLRAHALGEVFVGPVDVVFDERNVLQPDLAFISASRRHIVLETRVAGAPDLCIEVLSPGNERHDRERKAALYAAFGVRWYWIVDPDAPSVEEFDLAQGRRTAHAVGSNVFLPELFPGLAFAPADLVGGTAIP